MPKKLQVAYLGSDIFCLSLEHLLSRSDVLVTVIFAGQQNVFSRIRNIASRSRVTIITEPFEFHVHEARLEGVDVLLTAGYSRKIPSTVAKFALNVHPTLLPLGRGPLPIPWVLFDHPEAGGVTLHAHSVDFDAGPIVSNRTIPNTDDLSFEAYVMVCNQLGADLVSQFVDDPETQFGSAKPQDVTGLSLLPAFPDHRRVISATMSGAEIVETVRKLGPIGALLDIGSTRVRITRAEFVADAGGKVRKQFESNSLHSALRCADGFILFRPSDIHLA